MRENFNYGIVVNFSIKKTLLFTLVKDEKKREYR